MTKLTREALTRLLYFVESRFPSGLSIFDEADVVPKFIEFTRFCDFVFFVCGEKGQKNITVSKAIAAWKLVLSVRFQLLNQWCDFVEKNLLYNISEDTWQQVLVFSRCVHESLEGYDPKGAWPVLIDDFVERMQRISGSNNITNFCCACGNAEIPYASLPGLRGLPGLKGTLSYDCMRVSADLSDMPIQDSRESNWSAYSKGIIYGAPHLQSAMGTERRVTGP